MATTDPIKAIEELNLEIIENNQTEEIMLARKLIRAKNAFPYGIPKLIKEYYQKKRRDKLNNSISIYTKPEDREYACPEPITDKSGVVYTCITKDYDDPIEPVFLSSGLEYVLYTDKDEVPPNSVWTLRSISELHQKTQGTFANRYYKFHPFELFEGKDYSIYVDGNVKIVSDITGLYSVAKESESGLAIHKHVCRDCAYLDAKWCLFNGRGNAEAIKTQMERYKQEGFPEHYGLRENTIIVVDLHNPLGKTILDAWWDEYTSSGTGRDQAALSYVIWKLGLTMDMIGNLGNDEYHNPKFRINSHSRQNRHGINSLE